MHEILITVIVLGVIGVIIGLFLTFSSDKFEVKVDERVTKVREALPGNNCGGCGYAGCDALAKAIVAGEANVNACPVGGSPVGTAIAAIMGVESAESDRKVAFVRCAGDCEKAGKKYEYIGVTECNLVADMPGNGDKTCNYGCLGYGSCVAVCEFDAIHIINGIAVVDEEACKACGQCVKACPRGLIELVKADSKVRVYCNSKDKGPVVKKGCSVGCIGCMLCTKQCPVEAITVKDNLATIDYDKCIACGACVEKCPVKAIHLEDEK